MKRDLFGLVVATVLMTVSCGSLRHVPDDPLGGGISDSYASQYFYMEGAKQFNNKNYDAAMDVISRSLDYDTLSAAASYSLAQYYMSLGDRNLMIRYNPLARELILRAVRLAPDNYWYRNLLALNYLRSNDREKAIEQYEELSHRYPANTEVLLTLASLYDEVGDYRKELKALKRYGRVEDVDDELKYQRFICYLQLGELDSAYYESDNPSEIIGLLMDNTRDLIEKANNQMDKIRCRSLLDVVMKFCDVVSGYEPGLMAPYSQKALAYYWLGENEKTFDILAKGLRNVTSHKDRAALYNLRGDLYHNLNDLKSMYADYDSTLMLDPDNISVLNNYSYFMALEDRNLEKALSMSLRTLELEPMNPTFLDTYAWILFRMKRYKEALEYLEKAIRYMETDNPEIYEHYGDALYMCGEIDKAVQNWHKAVQYNSSSPTIDSKIKLQKYVQ